MPTEIITLKEDGGLGLESIAIEDSLTPQPYSLTREGLRQYAVDCQQSRDLFKRLDSLYNRATGLESLADTIEAIFESPTVTPNQIEQFEELANQLASPDLGESIVLTDSTGRVSTEALSNAAQRAFAEVFAGASDAIASAVDGELKCRSLSSTLREKLEVALADTRRLKGQDNIRVIAQDYLRAIACSDGPFDLTASANALARFTGDLEWVVKRVGPDTVEIMKGLSIWLSKIDPTNDNTLAASFTEVTIIPQVPARIDWVSTESEDADFIERVSDPYFGGKCFIQKAASAEKDTDVTWLVNNLCKSRIEFTQPETTPVISDEPLMVNVDTVIDMLENCKAILEYVDLFKGVSANLNRELGWLIKCGGEVIPRTLNMETLTESAQAKLILAIQAPHYMTLKIRSPFRDVLYEAIHVVTGVVSMANSVKTAVFSSE